jgi:tRNA wybutosine-synthesizing protein 3
MEQKRLIMENKDYLDAKEHALQSLDAACAEQKVDEGIRSILTLINGIEGFYTSSSCAGRIVLLEIPRIGDKRRAKFLGIWHRTVQAEEITVAASSATTGLLWLLAQAPILHIGVQTPALADAMIKTAVSCGFKNSAIKSTGKKIVIEVCSTERLDAPVGRDGHLFCEQNYLFLLVDIANEVIERSRKKLAKFEKKLANSTIFQQN